MTRILLSHCARLVHSWQMARRLTLRLSLFSILVVLAGCEGSSLGDNLGKTLEPDPLLADNPVDLANAEGSEVKPTDAKPEDAKAENKPTSVATAEDAKPSAAADNDNEPKPATNTANEPKVVGGDYNDLAKAPEEIQPYLVDLLELGLLEVRAPEPKSVEDTSSDENDDEEDSAPPKPAAVPPGPNEFRPNQAVTRREYARWLLAVNNRFYQGERDRKIRPGVTSSQPVFQDVPTSDPDFESIQGLAEAGIIPSPLTGSSTTVTFRPDAPLTRKDLLLWKVPLDTRQALPEASISAVQQAWGFQDAEKIEPRALQAVLADYQNGDFANIRRAYSYTTLFQPDKAATRAEAAAVLWRFGNPAEGITAEEIRGNRG